MLTSYPVKYKYIATINAINNTDVTTSIVLQLAREAFLSSAVKVEKVRPLILL